MVGYLGRQQTHGVGIQKAMSKYLRGVSQYGAREDRAVEKYYYGELREKSGDGEE